MLRFCFWARSTRFACWAASFRLAASRRCSFVATLYCSLVDHPSPEGIGDTWERIRETPVLGWGSLCAPAREDVDLQ
ncbi:hypothetical protein PSA01_00840 [Pseudonocardia saturnea]|uniref:Secreted protein n=1 Tax=Pseudonocardia saturnea TaxID=33909 RepID=A0ABQ0RQV2_9PSEU|nr:hypothetical protein Pdca_30990 [Pseudonocardia autotrophica]GEC23055.1 hypothetical protein PSA01_00840 [Pseudonocardia saturnea]